MLKKYSDRKLEIQKARAHWRRWQEEKVKLQEEKIEETKSVQVNDQKIYCVKSIERL